MTARSGSEQALHAAGGRSHKCDFYRYGYLLTWGAQLHFIILYTLRLYCNIFLPFVSVRYWVSFVGSKYDLYPTLSITTCNCSWYIAEPCHSMVIFLQNTHKRHPIPGPWWLGMRCVLWVQDLIYILHPSRARYGVPLVSSNSDLYPISVTVMLPTVEPLYNTIVFHQNTHKRHPIARP